MRLCFNVYGKVQGVMFRRTFCLAARKRGFEAGATNDLKDRTRVKCSIYGDRESVNLFIKELEKLDRLNSWGACVERVERLEEFHCLTKHDVTTDDVDDRPWSADIEFFL